MNTPAHLVFGMAAFGRPARAGVTLAALFGALVPDLSLYLMAGVHLLILGTPAETVFGALYFSPEWQAVFRIDNSFVIWGLLCTVGLMLRSQVLVAFAGAALLHLALDFPLHHDDGRAHFWPITNWIFQSPVSYWDRNHYGGIVGLVEALAVLGCAVWLWGRFRRLGWRIVVVALALIEVLPTLAFLVFMSPP